MCAQDVLACLVFTPIVPPSDRTAASLLVHILHILQILLRQVLCSARLIDEEGVVRVTRRVLLWLEEGVKIPEGALHPLIGGHLLETHQQQNVANLRAHLHERMQGTTLAPQAACVVEIQRLELLVLPRPFQDHFLGHFSNSLALLLGEGFRLDDLERGRACWHDQLPLLQCIQLLLGEGLQGLEVSLDVVRNAVDRRREGLRCLVHGDPAILHGDTAADLADIAQGRVQVLLGAGALRLDAVEHLHLRAALLGVGLTLGGQLPAFALHR
mmetsp:Transcript_66677/g.168137  ORF Transcript_66677/g.168137 Transcript_66677/m.168137 type:complete len:270 (-) Transcript_66677:201-1010(-)